MSAPAQIVIFGASGDLTRRKLIPALASLAASGQPPSGFSVVAVSLKKKSDETFRAELRSELPPGLHAGFNAMASRVFYQPGDVRKAADVEAVAKRLQALPGGGRTGRLFYLSIMPELFPVAVAQLAEGGMLAMRKGETEAWRRVLIEKPFGEDLASACARHLTFDVQQTYPMKLLR
jgi:glucose-6-phosphate 1-dehydrogenase